MKIQLTAQPSQPSRHAYAVTASPSVVPDSVVLHFTNRPDTAPSLVTIDREMADVLIELLTEAFAAPVIRINDIPVTFITNPDVEAAIRYFVPMGKYTEAEIRSWPAVLEASASASASPS